MLGQGSKASLWPSEVTDMPANGEDVVYPGGKCEKRKMWPRLRHGEYQRLASLAWVAVLSLLLVWIGTQSRLADVPACSVSASVAAVAAPEQVAKLSAAGKVTRSPEFRSGSGPDFLALAAEPFTGTAHIGRGVPSCGRDDPDCESHQWLPEPRAPPLA